MKNGNVIAIHQPSFFPWLGFFDKIIRADVFVILDNVQFPKKGGYWANRVRIIINGKVSWITMPVIRAYSGFRKINEMEIDNSKPWKQKIIKTISHNYQKSPFFKEIFPVLSEIIGYETKSLLEFNLFAIKNLCSSICININRFRMSSSLNTEGNSTDLILSIVKSLNGTKYLSGAGALKYIDESKFANAGIKLTYQNFNHPVYQQFNTESFISGLSIIDSLMNCGIEGVKQLVNYKHELNKGIK